LPGRRFEHPQCGEVGKTLAHAGENNSCGGEHKSFVTG
jgi:hypothetical protein